MRYLKPIRLLIVLLLLSIMLGLSVAESVRESGEETFSCFVYDEQGNKVNAYWSDKDAVWYLFVPSTVEISDMRLFYTGQIEEVSQGRIKAFRAAVIDAFRESGDRLQLTDSDGTEHTIQVMQSTIPSVHILLRGTTLETIHSDQDAKHLGNSLYIMDPDGSFDFAAEGSVEMKGRGNTTWQMFEKKGYQIKFNKETSILGMGKAEKWVLLANAGDDSMMRTMLTYRMASNLGMTYVPSFEYVDLWVDGDYLGTYLLGEKVELGSSRLALEDELGVLFEQDEAYYGEEAVGFFSEFLQRHFVMKEIMTEDTASMEAATADFQASVDELAAYLYTTPSAEVTLDELSTMIDVDSFAKCYLVSEYVLNREAIASSFYWYKDGPEDVIHLGPIWDYDTCMGNDSCDYTENYAHNHPLFRYLLAVPEFYDRVMALTEACRPYFQTMPEDAGVLEEKIRSAAEMNYLRWDVLGKPTNKDRSYFADTFADAVSNVRFWLEQRESAFTVAVKDVVYSTVTGDGKRVELFCEDHNARSDVSFVVWGVENGQNDIRKYPAFRNSKGVLRATVDLARHNEYGMYMISGFAGEESFAKGLFYVEEPDRKIRAKVSEGCEAIDIAFTDPEPHQEVRFAVWSDAGGQDDLQWYDAVRVDQTNQWTYSVDLHDHNTAGKYNIHVYSIDNAEQTKQMTYVVNVEKAIAHPGTMAAFDDNTMSVTFTDSGAYENVRVAVWSEAGGQDDLYWYVPMEEEKGRWVLSVDLQNHDSTGKYNIHVYSVTDDVYTKLSETIAQFK